MMKSHIPNSIGIWAFAIFTTAVSLSACGQRKNETASVSVTIPGFALPNDDRITSLNPVLSTLASSAPLLPPETISGFKCIAVNIMGAGIPNTDSDPDRSPATVLAEFGKKNFCSYPGKFSAIIERSSAGNTLTIEDAPVGENRIIEVVGIQVPAGASCPTSVHDNNGEALFYHLGHKVMNIAAGDNVVSIDNKYSTTYPRVFALAGCGDVPIKITTETGSNNCTVGYLTPGDYRYYNFKIAEGSSNTPLTQIKIMEITPNFPTSSYPNITSPIASTPECIPGSTTLRNSVSVFCRLKYLAPTSGANLFAAPESFDVRVRVYEMVPTSGGHTTTENYLESTLHLDAPCS